MFVGGYVGPGRWVGAVSKWVRGWVGVVGLVGS